MSLVGLKRKAIYFEKYLHPLTDPPSLATWSQDCIRRIAVWVGTCSHRDMDTNVLWRLSITSHTNQLSREKRKKKKLDETALFETYLTEVLWACKRC